MIIRPIFFLWCIALQLSPLALAQRVRNIVADEKAVISVNTAVGFSTIIQFDTKPTSAVIGDQDSFKVEYVGNSLTIKPLSARSKTNLFVFTDYDRFNFTLVAGSKESADYLVVVKRSTTRKAPPYLIQGTKPEDTSKPVPLVTKQIGISSVGGGVSLTAVSAQWPESLSSLVINVEFSLTDQSVSALAMKEGDLEIFQNGRKVPIESIYLDQQIMSRGLTPVHGTLVLRQKHLKGKDPLTLRLNKATPGSKLPVELILPFLNIKKGVK